MRAASMAAFLPLPLTFLKVFANHHDTYHDVQGPVYYTVLSFLTRSPLIIAVTYNTPPRTTPISLPSPSRKPSGSPPRLVPHMRQQWHKQGRPHGSLTTVSGLFRVRKTLVGDTGIRNVSGREKKRVSISGALACRSLVNYLDSTQPPPRRCCIPADFGCAARLEVSIP